MIYCIVIHRDSEEVCILHTNFITEPTRQDILDYIEREDIEYDDNYGKIDYYCVSNEKHKAILVATLNDLAKEVMISQRIKITHIIAGFDFV